MSFRKAIAFAGVLCALGLSAQPAQAIIVERVVAVVGEKPVLLSELRHRARPRLIVLAMQQPDAARQAAGETQAFKETLDEMINERLLEQAADKAHVGVSVEEVDHAVRQKADGLHYTLPQLFVEAAREGFSEQDYRDELRRQILEGKLTSLRVQGRVRVTEQDARASYDHLIKEIGNEAPVELQAIAMQLVPSPPAIEAKKLLAQEIVTKARGGANFCDLVKLYSDDTSTKDTCGSKGVQSVKVLFPVVREQLATMKEGDVSNPIVIGDQAIVIFRLAKREAIPPYDQVKEQMIDRATNEAVDHQKKLWLEELRRGVFLEIRL